MIVASRLRNPTFTPTLFSGLGQMSTNVSGQYAVQSPREYQPFADTGGFREIGRWRSGRDSNPRYGFAVYSLSRRAPSTTRPPLRMPGRRKHLGAERGRGKVARLGRGP